MTSKIPQNWNTLTAEEARIIEGKGTEMPGSGEYNHFDLEGTFVCRRCETPLYSSKSKFDSGCGWPAFDDAIGNNVRETLDADGRRTEITCNNCGAHLGHVFRGERMTMLNTRHCVNSLSMKFVKKDETMRDSSPIDAYKMAYFGGGCFWCLEAVFQRLEGVIVVKSGYMGGQNEFPTYKEVCRGQSGHIEVVAITYDPKIISYDILLDVFFATHDPTTYDRQGADSGSQYRSVVFGDTQDIEMAQAKKKELEENGTFSKIVTEFHLSDRFPFWQAEIHHQNYYNDNNMRNPYCSAVIDPKISKLREKFRKWLKSPQ